VAADKLCCNFCFEKNVGIAILNLKNEIVAAQLCDGELAMSTQHYAEQIVDSLRILPEEKIIENGVSVVCSSGKMCVPARLSYGKAQESASVKFIALSVKILALLFVCRFHSLVKIWPMARNSVFVW
jgi:hypothetical protein